MLTPSLVEQFQVNGFLLLKKFYSVQHDVEPIRSSVQRIIQYACEKEGLDVDASTPDVAMGDAYMALYKRNPTAAATVYDTVKQIPQFVALTAAKKNSDLFLQLRRESDPAIAAGGSGIRIDRPGDKKFFAHWHQEFPAQLRSLDGIVFWSPLIEMTQQLGPVAIASQSHKAGCLPVNRSPDQSGAYALRLNDEKSIVSNYQHVAPLSLPGDLLVMDFLTLHQSGENTSNTPRWSMQFRYFNLLDPVGREIGWSGSFASGADFTKIIPSLLKE